MDVMASSMDLDDYLYDYLDDPEVFFFVSLFFSLGESQEKNGKNNWGIPLRKLPTDPFFGIEN